jgi:hypothetical protein
MAKSTRDQIFTQVGRQPSTAVGLTVEYATQKTVKIACADAVRWQAGTLIWNAPFSPDISGSMRLPIVDAVLEVLGMPLGGPPGVFDEDA